MVSKGIKIPCYYCHIDHTFVCDCGRKHDDHVFGGGCKVTGCEGYSQKHQRLPEESTKDFNTRILKQARAKR